MQHIKKYVSILILVFSFHFFLSAQDSLRPKIKTYKTWVSLINPSNSIIKGYLCEIKDSSILISNSVLIQDYLAGSSKTTNIGFSNIDLIKTRRVNNIGWGALIGSASAFVVGTTIIAVAAREMGFYTVIAAIYGGLGFAVLGAGTGALVGSIRDRIPIHGRNENFNLYRGVLQDYSYVHEYPGVINFYEHKGFAGMAYGPSFPSGDFTNKSSSNGKTDITENGYSANFFIGYRFTKRFGLLFSETDNSFSIDKNGSTTYWEIGGIKIEPMFSFPYKNRLFLDLKPGFGYANAYLVEDDIEKKNGNGVGINLDAALTFNFSKRWGFITETGFLFTHQVFDDKSTGNFQVFNVNFGFVYRFSKRSL